MKEAEAKLRLCPLMTQKVWSERHKTFELVKTSCLTRECLFWKKFPHEQDSGDCSIRLQG